ncbi:MAG: hypothetical protein BWX84_01913 [Verrucomicrobia bacterium ADurb.Bin118]|nr:MAG: hypothetical protein BWX84_01913 [Verrucomicrobia bacterium ADurb.Bin118]
MRVFQLPVGQQIQRERRLTRRDPRLANKPMNGNLRARQVVHVFREDFRREQVAFLILRKPRQLRAHRRQCLGEVTPLALGPCDRIKGLRIRRLVSAINGLP